MGNRKEHHYLPRFYLKNFSVGQQEVHIRLHNIESDFYFDHAAISDQAKKKYLYGKDDIMESQLEKLEGHSSGVIRSIIDDDQLPSSAADLLQLGKFILFQQARTVRHGEVMNTVFNTLNQGMFGDEAPDDEMSIRDMLELMTKRLPYLAHLDYKLIINDTSIPFITSDNPVVLYNQMMEIKRHRTPAAWANMGLQVFFPISPDHLIYIHDSNNYIAGAPAGTTVIGNITERDVNQLNALQYLNCGELLFFDEHFDKGNAESLKKESQEFREKLWIPKHVSFGSFHWVDMGRPQINLQVSFSRLSPRGKQFKPGNRMVYLRHPDFYELRESLVPDEMQ